MLVPPHAHDCAMRLQLGLKRICSKFH